MAKAVAEEVRRQFVVLPVGGIGVHRQCTLAQRAQALRQQCRLRLLPARSLVTQSLRAQPADTGTDQYIGQQAALGQAQQAGSGPVGGQFFHHRVHRVASLVADLGNQGNSIGVVRWYSRYSSPRVRSACASV